MTKTMSNRLKEIEAEDGDSADDAVIAEADEAIEEAAPADDAEADSGARVRDEKGRFVAKDKDDEQDSAATEEVASGADAPVQAAASTPTPEPVEPPPSWSAEDKALFSQLPQDVQATLARREKEREADYTRKSQGIAHWTPLESRHGQRARSYGTTTAQLADRLLQTQEMLATGSPEVRKAVILSIAQDYGIDLAAAPQAQGPANQFPQDPAMQAVAQVRNEWTAFMAQQQQQAQAAALNAGLQQIESFKSEKNPDGTLKHPHFDTVYEHIETLASGVRARGQAPNLSDLYAQAVWMNETTRKATIESETRKAALAADKAATDPIKRRAAQVNLQKSNVGNGSRASGKGKSMEDTMRLTLAARGYGQDD